MDQATLFDEYATTLNSVVQKLNYKEVDKAISIIRGAISNKVKIFTCGNGGSAHTASHFITDWNKMINLETGNQIFAYSLCDNLGLVTAYANDLNYNEIFSGQLAVQANEGDLLICVSGSGNSLNLVKAVQHAKKNDIKTLGILGYDGGRLLELCDNYVLVPSFDMQICEDVHLMIGHIIMKALTHKIVVKD